MRRIQCAVLMCAVLGLSSMAYAWSEATHAYIAKRVQPSAEQAGLMFGSVAPDINQLLSTDQNSIFFTETHYDVMNLWDAAAGSGKTAESLAFGYVSHNEAWGADYYAHIRSHVYPRYLNPDSRYAGQNGYVWVKAGQLCSLLKKQLQASGAASPLSDYLLSDPMNCHFIVEYSMDVLLKARDAKIVQKLLASAATYDSATMGQLFVAGYPAPVAPTLTVGDLMATYQGSWAGLVQMYAVSLDKPTMKEAIPSVAGFLEFLAEQLLGDQLRAALGLQPGDPIPDAVKQQLLTLIQLGVTDSVMLCSYDYFLELDLTICSVKKELARHGVHLSKPVIAKR